MKDDLREAAPRCCDDPKIITASDDFVAGYACQNCHTVWTEYISQEPAKARMAS
jgi:hypothetical protein